MTRRTPSKSEGTAAKRSTKVAVSVDPDRHHHIHEYATSRGHSVAALLRNAVGILTALAAAVADGWLIAVADEATLEDEVADWGREGWQVRVPHLPLKNSGRPRGSQGMSSQAGDMLNIAVTVDFRDELKRLADVFGVDSIQDFVLLALEYEERRYHEEHDNGRKLFLTRSRIGFEATASGPPPGAWEESLPTFEKITSTMSGPATTASTSMSGMVGSTAS